MSNAAKPVELPEDLRAFAEERVRSGQATSVEDVVREALEEKKRAALEEALDLGLEEARAGRVTRGAPAEILARIRQRLGVVRKP